MGNLLKNLGFILLSVIIISCGNNGKNENNENRDTQQGIKPIEANIEKGLMSSHTSSTMQSRVVSYDFDRETKTVTEMTISNLACRNELSECVELLRLANKKDVIFRSSEISVGNRAKEFDRKVVGELHFQDDSKMQATLLFHVKGSNKGSKLLGTIMLSSDNFKKSSSDVTIYVKGKQAN